MSIRKPALCDRCRTPADTEADPAVAPVKTLDFTPVPRKYRHDGWTPDRQRGFITALAATGSVKHAAHAVGMTPEGAYYLRRQPGASGFCAAWDAALDTGVDRLVAATMERALNGVAVPVFWQGKKIGERRAYNDRLAMFHLRHRLPERYGALQPPGRGTKSADTHFREAGYDPEEAEEEEREGEHVSERMRLRVSRMHESWRAILFQDPAKRAAYELLFGEDGAADEAQASGIRFSRFPPELSYALIGIAEQEAADREREEGEDEAGSGGPA